jgi:hypothetical protein
MGAKGSIPIDRLSLWAWVRVVKMKGLTPYVWSDLAGGLCEGVSHHQGQVGKGRGDVRRASVIQEGTITPTYSTTPGRL